MKAISVLLLSLLFSVSLYAKGSLKVLVNLSPAGSFEIKSSKVKGSVKKQGDAYVTSGLSVRVKSFDTGLELRDNHLKDKLEAKKHKKIEILKGTAKGGKGVAIIQVKDIQKKISFSYSVKGNRMMVKFPLNLKDFKFSGIKYAGIGVKDTVQVSADVPIK
ncbi:MAG: YceI family protein [Bdellovibrionota bacterium]|nr:YceI family protein [Bdellovibrionota bacterium]